MHILLVTKHYPPPWGGIQKVAVDIERGLNSRKHTVDLLNGDAHSVPLPKLVRPRDLIWTKATWNESFGLRALNPFAIFAQYGYREMVYQNLMYRLARKRLSKQPAQIMHLLTIESYSTLFAAPTTVPIVVHVHAEELEHGAPLHISAERADILLCTSIYGSHILAALMPEQKHKIRIVQPAVDTNGFQAPPRHARDASIVTVARLDSRKNIDAIIRALGLLTHELPDATLTIIGDGPERRTLETVAHTVAPGKVRFLGWVSEARKRELLSRARVFALCPKPRDNRAEGFGIAFVEAQAAGTPVVGSIVGGVPESAGPHSALVQDPTDAASIAHEIKTLWTVPKAWEKQHREGLAYAKQFTLEKYLDGILAAYGEARAAHASKTVTLSQDD